MLIPYKELIKKYNIQPTGILHVGANTGQEAPDYYSSGVEKTIWVEADPTLMKHLISNLVPYSHHLVFNDCCTDEDGKEVTFNIANNGGQSSSILALGTHAQVHPEVHYVSFMSMRTTRIDTLLARNKLNIEDYSFVNIDIQGAELLCLKGFGELLNKVDHLYIEVNDNELYTGAALFPEVRDYLSTFGFTMREKVMSGNHGWGDCYFSKTINN